MAFSLPLALRLLPYVGVVFAAWWIYSAGQAHERDKTELTAFKAAAAQMQKRIALTDQLNEQAADDAEARRLRNDMLENHVARYQQQLIEADAEDDLKGQKLNELTTELKKTQDAKPIFPAPRAASRSCALSDTDVKRLLDIDAAGR